MYIVFILKYLVLIHMMQCDWSRACEVPEITLSSSTPTASVLDSTTVSENIFSIENYLLTVVKWGKSIDNASDAVKLFATRSFFFQSCTIAFCQALLNHKPLLKHYSANTLQDLLRENFITETVKLSDVMRRCMKEARFAHLILNKAELSAAVRIYSTNLFDSVCVNMNNVQSDENVSTKVSLGKNIFPILLARFLHGENVELLSLLDFGDGILPTACHLSLFDVFQVPKYLKVKLHGKQSYGSMMSKITSEFVYFNVMKDESEMKFSVTHISKKFTDVMFNIVEVKNAAENNVPVEDIRSVYEMDIGEEVDENDILGQLESLSVDFSRHVTKILGHDNRVHKFGIEKTFVEESSNLLGAAIKPDNAAVIPGNAAVAPVKV